MSKALVIFVKNSIVESVKEFTGEVDYINNESTNYIENLLSTEAVDTLGMTNEDSTSCTYNWDNNSISLVWMTDDEPISDCVLEESITWAEYYVTVPYYQYQTYRVSGTISGAVTASSKEEAISLLQAGYNRGEFYEEEEDQEMEDSGTTEILWDDAEVNY